MARRKANEKHEVAKTNSKTNASAATSTTIEPFFPSPSILLPFLETLPTNHIYLTSIDKTSPTVKRNAFLVPVVLNTLIILGLCYRIFYAVPTYLWLIVTIFGYDTAAKVDTKVTPMRDVLGVVATRTSLLMMDYVIFAIIGAWPWQFFFGHKDGGYVGPASWRWTVGAFKEKEVVVRRSRRWDKTVFEEEAGKDKEGSSTETKPKTLTMNEVLTVKLKVAPAMDQQYLAKTGYAMLDRDWDLDFAGMVNAYQLVQGSKMTNEDLQNKAFVYNANEKTWLMWTVADTDSSTLQEAGEKDAVVENFREKLVAMGHEDLFYRWIELVQYESSVPGGMTEARQLKVIHEARKIFSEKGINFDAFFNDVGGQFPGLDG